MNKRIFLCFLLLFFSTTLLFSAITDIMVSSALGMMRTHYLIPIDGDETYTCLTENATVIDTDVAAIGICVAEYYGLNRRNSNVTNLKDFVDKVTIDITYDGYFTSDENPSIKRPYEIHMVEKRGRTISGGTGNYGVYYVPSYKFPSLSEGGDTSKPFPSSSLVGATTDTDGYFWADIILQLPGEPSSDRKGVTVGGVYYPIVEGTYSTEVTITISGTVQDRTTGTERVESQSFKIPLMAEHILDSPIGYGESQVSMNVSPTAYAGNLNLEQMLETGTPVEVGRLSFMIRENHKNSDGGRDEIYNNGTLNENTCTFIPKYRIFLSASSDPLYQNTNGFLLVHEDYEAGIDSYNSRNSIPFYVQVDGTGDTTGRSGLYDGRAYMVDTVNADGTTGKILEGDGSTSATVLVPKCIYFEYLPPDWVHMHVFEGDISVYVNANPNHMLNAGRYRGDIYVHVVDIT